MGGRDLSNVSGKIRAAKILAQRGIGIGKGKGVDRLPPGQVKLRDPKEFPVLDLGFRPEFDPASYRFKVTGLVENPIDWSWEELKVKLPRTELAADFHCVTKWSKYDINWAGIKLLDLEKLVKPKPEAKYLIQIGLDDYSTNSALSDLRHDNVLLAYELEGEDLPAEHGAPLRMIVPHLYAWKGSKFLYRLHYKATDDPGFWEVRGYHNHADPWLEERYG